MPPIAHGPRRHALCTRPSAAAAAAAALCCLLAVAVAPLPPAARAATIPPDFCAVAVFYNRPHYLLRTIRAFILYMLRVEPRLRYKLIVLDNGSHNITRTFAMAALQRLIARSMLTYVQEEQTLGLSGAFNKAFHELCAATGAPYILSLEEDWEAKHAQWPAGCPMIGIAMEVLAERPEVEEVWLRDTEWRLHLHSYSGWRVAPEHSAWSYRYRTSTCPPGGAWGAYTNGASLKHVGRLRSVGVQRGADGEPDFARRVCAKGLRAAEVCCDDACVRATQAAHLPAYYSLFAHIGDSRVVPFLDVRSGGANVTMQQQQRQRQQQ